MAGTKRIAVLAAGLMLAGPAVGAAPQHVLCSEADNPDLDIHVEALAVEIINHEASDTELAAETAEGKDILIRAPFPSGVLTVTTGITPRIPIGGWTAEWR